jgi:hypothetical protein
MQPTIHSLLTRLEQSIQEGVCCRCGKTAPLYSRGLCDLCVEAEWERITREQQRAAFLGTTLHWVRKGVLLRDTLRIRFETSNPPPEENASAWDSLRKWKVDINVYLWGPSGVGKSHLGRCLLNRALEQGKTIAEGSARGMVRTAGRFDQGHGKVRMWGKADVLLIDDIDKGAYNEDRLSVLWELLDERSRHRRITITTSNLDPKTLAEDLVRRVPENASYGTATLDRLKPLRVFGLTGLSLR